MEIYYADLYDCNSSGKLIPPSIIHYTEHYSPLIPPEDEQDKNKLPYHSEHGKVQCTDCTNCTNSWN